MADTGGKWVSGPKKDKGTGAPLRTNEHTYCFNKGLATGAAGKHLPHGTSTDTPIGKR